jgi:hypothetical protein
MTSKLLRFLVQHGDVDTNEYGLIEKQSLLDLRECLAMIVNWGVLPLGNELL